MDVFLFYFLNSIFSHKGRKIIIPLRKRELGFLGINTYITNSTQWARGKG
jgi:hypothetical protein